MCHGLAIYTHEQPPVFIDKFFLEHIQACFHIVYDYFVPNNVRVEELHQRVYGRNLKYFLSGFKKEFTDYYISQ